MYYIYAYLNIQYTSSNPQMIPVDMSGTLLWGGAPFGLGSARGGLGGGGGG